jgi:hypothetical protein
MKHETHRAVSLFSQRTLFECSRQVLAMVMRALAWLVLLGVGADAFVVLWDENVTGTGATWRVACPGTGTVEITRDRSRYREASLVMASDCAGLPAVCVVWPRLRPLVAVAGLVPSGGQRGRMSPVMWVSGATCQENGGEGLLVERLAPFVPVSDYGPCRPNADMALRPGAVIPPRVAQRHLFLLALPHDCSESPLPAVHAALEAGLVPILERRAEFPGLGSVAVFLDDFVGPAEFAALVLELTNNESAYGELWQRAASLGPAAMESEMRQHVCRVLRPNCAPLWPGLPVSRSVASLLLRGGWSALLVCAAASWAVGWLPRRRALILLAGLAAGWAVWLSVAVLLSPLDMRRVRDRVVPRSALVAISASTRPFVWSAHEPQRGRRLFVAVLSGHANWARRALQRQGWLRHGAALGFEHRFFVARRPCARVDWEENPWECVDEDSRCSGLWCEPELAEEGDVVWVNCSDYYRNLPQLVAAAIRWAARPDQPPFEHLLKVDDDVSVDLAGLARLLEGPLLPREGAWSGSWAPSNIQSHWVHGNNQKYGARWADYPARFNPPMMRGAGYLLSRNVVKWLATQPLGKHSPAEDVNLAIWLANTDARLVPLDRFCCLGTECSQGEYVVRAHV